MGVPVRVQVIRNNETLYRLNDLAIGSNNPSKLAITSFWLMAVFGKLMPCTLISVFIGLLLKKLHESAARRKRLFAHSDKGRNSSQRGGGGGRTARHQCTTTMLLVIIIMYIVCEIPQVFAIIMSAMSRQFFQNVYFLIADTLDMIALINNAINFVLYCTMSQQFREHLLVVRACTGAGPQSARFNKKTYHSVEQSGVNTRTTNNHADNGLCVTGDTNVEKSVSQV
ncbi:G-protein coupled receptor dmsr-1-like [Littorina saxatilis]|uniref:G-protein coupled receptor dmsr-1-like n=1 Tax=Littorina saxatilis TaxID=31220 RepID=UPI0038B4D258